MKAAFGEYTIFLLIGQVWVRRKKTMRQGGELASYYMIKHELRYFEV